MANVLDKTITQRNGKSFTVRELFNKNHELFFGDPTFQSWKDQYGDKWQVAVNNYVMDALEHNAKRNAKYGTTGKVIIPEYVKPYVKFLHKTKEYEFQGNL
jgi:hypothetical protein